jgi:F-type H+-transporting ATPase subunit delta
MARRSVAARRYAEAVASMATLPGTWDEWFRDLTQVASAMRDPAIRAILADPDQDVTVGNFLDTREMRDGLRPETIRLLHVMASRRALGLVPEMVDWLHDFADKARGIRRIDVTSAVPLDQLQQLQVQTRLAGVGTDPTQVVLTLHVDARIVGGLVIREGDQIIDRSVRARLEMLRESMT